MFDSRSGRSAIALVAAGVLALGVIGPAAAQDEEVSGEVTIWTYVPQPEDKLPQFFAEAFPNVKVNVVEVPLLELPPKVLTSASTGSGPDIVQYNGPTRTTACGGPRWVRSGCASDMVTLSRAATTTARSSYLPPRAQSVVAGRGLSDHGFGRAHATAGCARLT